MFLPHLCGACWTQVRSKRDTSVEHARYLCGRNASEVPLNSTLLNVSSVDGLKDLTPNSGYLVQKKCNLGIDCKKKKCLAHA